MTATADEATRLRNELDANETSLPDATLDDLFDVAEVVYADYSRTVIYAAVRVQAIRNLMAAAAKDVDYDAGDSGEKASQRFKHLQALLGEYKTELVSLMTGEALPPVRWGLMSGNPPRNQDKPS